MRVERENCCDDLAVQICGNPLAYARGLTELEQLRGYAPRMAMAANGGSLLRRIERLLALRQSSPARSVDWTTTAVLALLVITVWAVPRLALTAPIRSSLVEPRPVMALRTAALDLAQAPAARPQPAPPSQKEKAKGEGFHEGLDRAGYRNLTVDQLISLRIHGIVD
jgi:hypothetical protein